MSDAHSESQLKTDVLPPDCLFSFEGGREGVGGRVSIPIANMSKKAVEPWNLIERGKVNVLPVACIHFSDKLIYRKTTLCNYDRELTR